MSSNAFDKGDPKKLFKLVEKIATGSYGTVFKAQNKRNNESVALKVVSLEEGDKLEEFLAEITIMRHLSHPNVVAFHGAWKKSSDLFIAMELCVGGAASDLYARVQRSVPENVIAVLMRDTLAALEYCHRQAVMHRDIKAANILLTESGVVKLTDFGVSVKMQFPGDKRKSLIGTPYWLAPEVVMVTMSYKPYGTEVDIWSLGVTCIELAETKPPRFGMDPTKAMNEIPRSPPPKLSDESLWSELFREFIAQCCDKRTEKRPSAKDLMNHPFVRSASDVSTVAAYIRKTQRGEWDPIVPPAVGPQRPSPAAGVSGVSGQRPTPLAAQRSPPAACRTPPHRRMTRAFFDDLTRIQTSEAGGKSWSQAKATAPPPAPVVAPKTAAQLMEEFSHEDADASDEFAPDAYQQASATKPSPVTAVTVSPRPKPAGAKATPFAGMFPGTAPQLRPSPSASSVAQSASNSSAAYSKPAPPAKSSSPISSSSSSSSSSSHSSSPGTSSSATTVPKSTPKAPPKFFKSAAAAFHGSRPMSGNATTYISESSGNTPSGYTPSYVPPKSNSAMFSATNRASNSDNASLSNGHMGDATPIDADRPYDLDANAYDEPSVNALPLPPRPVQPISPKLPQPPSVSLAATASAIGPLQLPPPPRQPPLAIAKTVPRVISASQLPPPPKSPSSTALPSVSNTANFRPLPPPAYSPTGLSSATNSSANTRTPFRAPASEPSEDDLHLSPASSTPDDPPLSPTSSKVPTYGAVGRKNPQSPQSLLAAAIAGGGGGGPGRVKASGGLIARPMPPRPAAAQ